MRALVVKSGTPIFQIRNFTWEDNLMIIDSVTFIIPVLLIGFSVLEVDVPLGLLPQDRVHKRRKNSSHAGNTKLHSRTCKWPKCKY